MCVIARHAVVMAILVLFVIVALLRSTCTLFFFHTAMSPPPHVNWDSQRTSEISPSLPPLELQIMPSSPLEEKEEGTSFGLSPNFEEDEPPSYKEDRDFSSAMLTMILSD